MDNKENGHKIDPLDQIMGVEEASQLWGLTPGHIKNLCNQGKIRARKIAKTWILNKNEPNPRQKKTHP